MNTIYIRRGEEYELVEQVATIGSFDGVYRGHQLLIGRVANEVKRSGMALVVTTLDRHSRQVLQADYQPELLSTLDEKLLLLSKTHIDNSFVLHFDTSLAALSAHDFMREVLCKQLNVKKLIIGHDNRFEHNRSRTLGDYVQYGREVGIEVIRADAFPPNDEKVSSPIIRNDLRTGNIEAVDRPLGYPYTIESRIVSGCQNGCKMGFPTVNLDANGCQQLLPASGVYAVMVRLKDSVGWKQGMIDIGYRSIFNSTTASTEVNLFNFTGNFYRQEFLASFISKIRGEHKSDSLEALTQQLKQDKEQINRLFNETYHIQGNIINTP